MIRLIYSYYAWTYRLWFIKTIIEMKQLFVRLPSTIAILCLDLYNTGVWLRSKLV
jgi:hypothetical protein